MNRIESFKQEPQVRTSQLGTTTRLGMSIRNHDQVRTTTVKQKNRKSIRLEPSEQAETIFMTGLELENFNQQLKSRILKNGSILN